MAESFTAFDLVVLALLGLLALGGLMRGFVTEALSFAAWVVAVVVVRAGHEPVTTWLLPRAGGEASAAIFAFLLLFFGALMLGRLLAATVGGAARRSVVGPFDRALGLGFGLLKGLILASALFLLLQFATGLFDPDEEPPAWLTRSRVAPLLDVTSRTMVEWVRDLRMPDPPAGAAAPASAGPGYPSDDRRALDRLIASGEAVEL